MIGIVTMYNSKKGFGFITNHGLGLELPVNFLSLGEDFKDIKVGEYVDFDIVLGDYSSVAVNIKRLDIFRKGYEYVAVGSFDGILKIVSLNKDGTYKYLDPTQNEHNVIYIISSKTLALQTAIEELEILVNNKEAKENDFQDFFYRHQDFILNDEYRKAHPKIVLTRDSGGSLIPDFVLEPLENSALADLLELKLPTAQIFVLKKDRKRFSAAVLEACAQLREYNMFFDDPKNRSMIYAKYKLLAYKPKMFVIIGRRCDINPMDVQIISSDVPSLRLKTYDEIIDRMKSKVNSMKK